MGTFRDTFSSRQINLIDLPCTKNARRIFAIVSKISIPTSASKNHGSHCEPSAPGSRLDADHPENGVLIPCRFTPDAFQQSRLTYQQYGTVKDDTNRLVCYDRILRQNSPLLQR